MTNKYNKAQVVTVIDTLFFTTENFNIFNSEFEHYLGSCQQTGNTKKMWQVLQ